MLRDFTPGQVPSQEIERELQATLAASREMGAEYDDHFVDSFMSKLAAYVPQRPRSARLPARQPTGRASERRLALAIVSIAVLVPLVAICIALPHGLLVFAPACGAIVLINISFAVKR